MARFHSLTMPLVVLLATCGAGSLAIAQDQTQQMQAATPAQAQTTDQNGAPLEEVVITGSMIRRPSSETTEAVTLLNADTLKQQGITNVEQVLSTLTSNNTSINVAQSIGTFTGGGTYANLRGLGYTRTLVLLDGQRLAPNAYTGDAVDLSGIPFSAIQSVEVLREGASALYGSDAIAGVVNFKTRTNFQGADIQGTLGYPTKHGGGSGAAELTLGYGDLGSDGYNVMLTGSYSRQYELQATQRGFSATGYDPSRGVYNTNNPGTWPGTLIDAAGNYWQPDYPACPGNNYLVIDPANQGNTCAYRYSAATDLQPDAIVTSGLASLTKTLPANNSLQLQYFYTRAKITAWSGPMFYFFQMDPASPYIPSASRLTCQDSCGPLTLTGGPLYAIWSDPDNNRYTGSVNTEQRALLTFSGNNSGWDYAASFNYSQNKNDNRNVAGYPNEDVLAPGGILSPLINPFGPQSAAGQALIDQSYISGTYLQGEDKRWSADAHATHPLGDAFDSGKQASLGLGITVGGEHFSAATTPYNDLTSAATGLTDSAVDASRQTQAVFMELYVPITHDFDVNLSDREDRYSDFGRTNNAKVALRYQPATYLTLRGAASTGFRAPSLNDLYVPNVLAASTSGAMGDGNPNCAGTPIPPFTAATCATQGLGLTGGNSQLTPETSQNYDLGVIVSPVENLGITLDYYRILLKNAIGNIPPSAIYGDPSTFASEYVLNDLGGLTPSIQEASSCDPYTLPTCGYILLTNQNTGRITTDGFDLSVQYSRTTAVGKFKADLEGIWVTEFRRQQYSGGPQLNLVGWYNNLPPEYRWQHNIRVDWSSPGGLWGAGLVNRFYSDYIDQYPDGNGNQRTVGSYSTFDAYASLQPIERFTVLFGVKNLFNTNPPYTNASQGNFAAGYNALNTDPLLRNWYVNVRYTIS